MNRRQCLTESEFREKRGAIPRASDLEATRRVNLRDTAESRVSDNVKGLLSGWSSKQKAQSPQLVIPNQGTDAWTALANDDGARENLQDINAGQTHRANLTLRVSEQQSDEAADFFYRNSGDARCIRVDRARGGGRGGRGGGILGSRRGRVGPTRYCSFYFVQLSLFVSLLVLQSADRSRAHSRSLCFYGSERQPNDAREPSYALASEWAFKNERDHLPWSTEWSLGCS